VLSLKQGRPLRAFHDDALALRTYQNQLLQAGIPLAWLTEVGVSAPQFSKAQRDFMDRPDEFADRL
jgi:hypothetical protein